MYKKLKTFLIIGVSFTSMLALSQSDSISGQASSGNKTQIVEHITAFDFILKGGVFLIPIVLLLMYTIFFTVEKFRYIKRMSKYNSTLLLDIKANLQAGNLDPVIETVSRDNSAYGSVLKEGVLSIGRPMSEIESNMEKVVNIEIGKMESKLGHLGLIAGIAPTLGFIGTISGVIKIFYSISITENVSIGNISGGLYEKMISSGSGLVVGIIAYSVYHLLNGMIDNYTLQVQKTNLEFVNLIQRPSNGNQTK
jgi:biopolymer transport protein ExbB